MSVLLKRTTAIRTPHVQITTGRSHVPVSQSTMVTELTAWTKNGQNTMGTELTANCKGGHTGNGTHCYDLNECTSGQDCDSNATCTNVHGSFCCSCNIGYAGNGKKCSNTNFVEHGITKNCDQIPFFAKVAYLKITGIP